MSLRLGRSNNMELLHLSVFHQKSESSTLRQTECHVTYCNATYPRYLVSLQTTSARCTATHSIQPSYRRENHRYSSRYLVSYQSFLDARL